MKFRHELPTWKVQDIELATQSEFTAIKQLDGSDPDTTHWVLIRNSQIPELIALLQRVLTSKHHVCELVGTVVDSATEEGQ